MHVVELTLEPTTERLAARPAHRRYLTRLHAEGKLLAAGPWADDRGALLVFTAPRTELDAILADDPYYRTTGVTVASVREWAPVIVPDTAPQP